MAKTRDKGVVVLTGVTGGVGAPLRVRLLEQGYDVIGCARSGADVRLDLEQEAAVDRAADEILNRLGTRPLAALINLAGVMVEGPIELVSPEAMRRQFQINVFAPAQLSRRLAPALRRSRGRIVNVGAVTARVSVPFFGAVAASKAALASLSETLRMELRPFGVDVLLIEPGALRTGIHADSQEDLRRRLVQESPASVAVYAPALEAARQMLEKSAADAPEVVAEAVLAAVTAPHPHARRLAGRGASTLAVLSKLPARTRDRLLLGQLGIDRALKARA